MPGTSFDGETARAGRTLTQTEGPQPGLSAGMIFVQEFGDALHLAPHSLEQFNRKGLKLLNCLARLSSKAVRSAALCSTVQLSWSRKTGTACYRDFLEFVSEIYAY